MERTCENCTHFEIDQMITIVNISSDEGTCRHEKSDGNRMNTWDTCSEHELIQEEEL